MKIALVKPSTGYFGNPKDEFAEAVMLYKMSEKTQLLLRDKNPKLYSIVQKFDQDELNLTYGLEPDGQPKVYRDRKGLVRKVEPGVLMDTIDEQRIGEADKPKTIELQMPGDNRVLSAA
ncbi:MAG: hypothetical protein IT342_23650 [Candidatus Melainabacteria bacterium]|nr:hypothetical protein [Candidatus Melainabacteria bacterium]